MKIAVFGATGGTGNEIVKQALTAGHEVTAFVRDASRLTIQSEQLRIVTDDVFDPASVAQAVQAMKPVPQVLVFPEQYVSGMRHLHLPPGPAS